MHASMLGSDPVKRTINQAMIITTAVAMTLKNSINPCGISTYIHPKRILSIRRPRLSFSRVGNFQFNGFVVFVEAERWIAIAQIVKSCIQTCAPVA